MKYDKKEEEQQYYNEQKERITLYMKHNVKGYKSVTFTENKRKFFRWICNNRLHKQR